MDVVHLQCCLLVICWLSTLCIAILPVAIYDAIGVKEMESFAPVDDPVLRRFEREITPNNNSGSLKRQTSIFNEGDLPDNLVQISKNNTYGAPVNSTVFEENHIYYNVTFLRNASTSSSYYVNLDNENCTHHEGLSRAHLKAAGITLSFDFPFYGHKLRNLTLATGGFLYTGNPDHSWIAATQYIAPLMADFALDLRNDSEIRYFDNGTSVTFEWRNAVLQEKQQAGPFTFQVTLRDDGTIIFYYVQLPVSVMSIPNDTHPVKVGVSDAYMIDRQRFIIRYRTIYEYHRIALNLGDIVNGSAMILEAQPTCISMESCYACVTANISGCLWCPRLDRCSDGLDRFHQDWHSNGCPVTATNATCPVSTSTMLPKSDKTGSFFPFVKTVSSTNVSEYSAGGRNRPVPTPDPNSIPGIKSAKYTLLQGNLSDIQKRPAQNDPYVATQNLVLIATPANYGVAIAAVLCVGIIGGLLGWVVYAYLRPHSTSGQWLIKYRPNQWRRDREDEIQIANTAF